MTTEEDLMRYAEGTMEIGARLRAENPGLPTMTSVVMAGDLYHAQGVEEALREGKLAWDEAVNLCGSYARVDAALRWQEEGRATRDALLDRWPGLWVGSDPDDADPRFLAVWKEARVRSGRVIYDGRPLPARKPVVVWRGQMPGASVGIAWTTDRGIARAFADGRGVRTKVAGGVVLFGSVARSDVIAFLTDRGESEIIVDPADVVREDDQ